MCYTKDKFLEGNYKRIEGNGYKNMEIKPINKERMMSTDEKIASVSASFAMEDMILTPKELERGRMILSNEIDVEDVVREITSRYVSVG